MDSTITKTFSALSVRNFRLFVFGQGLSLCGTWMQTIGLSWLVLNLTHSGTKLGLVVAAQFLPILLFGVWGGVIADRFNKRHILYFTQSAAAILALTLGLLVVTHWTRSVVRPPTGPIFVRSSWRTDGPPTVCYTGCLRK